MSNVYLVAEGEYSDYRIVAAFSTRALAQEMIDSGHADHDAAIEEKLLDPPTPRNDLVESGWREYSVTFPVDRTQPIRAELAYSADPKNLALAHIGDFGSWSITEYAKMAPYWSRCGGQTEVYLWARSVEHALKSAMEKRAQVLANPHLLKDRTGADGFVWGRSLDSKETPCVTSEESERNCRNGK